MKLRILGGDRQGAIISLENLPMDIGRDPECDLALNSDGVSRRHARLFREHGLYLVEDLGSTNGVRVNGQTIMGRKSLMNGDRIGIGDCLLLFTHDEAILDDRTLTAVSERQASRRAAGVARPTWQNPAHLALGGVIICLVLAAIVWLLIPPAPAPSITAPATGEPAARESVFAEPVNLRRQEAVAGRGVQEVEAVVPEAYEVGHYELRTEPAGAMVIMAAREMGRTPLILTGMQTGRHEVRFEMAGFEPATRHIFIDGSPMAANTSSFDLTQQILTCRVTSDPTGASVFHGPRLLGRTPLTVHGLPAGEYTLKLAAFGREAVELPIRLVDYRPSEAHAMLGNRTGSLGVVTFPAGAEIFIDGVKMGVSEGAKPGAQDSAPTIIRNLVVGRHTAYCVFAGQRSAVQQVTIEASDMNGVRLTVWIPSTTVTLSDGTQLNGMLRSSAADGTLDLATSPRQHRVLTSAQYSKVETVPYEDFLRRQQSAGDEP